MRPANKYTKSSSIQHKVCNRRLPTQVDKSDQCSLPPKDHVWLVVSLPNIMLPGIISWWWPILHIDSLDFFPILQGCDLVHLRAMRPPKLIPFVSNANPIWSSSKQVARRFKGGKVHGLCSHSRIALKCPKKSFLSVSNIFISAIFTAATPISPEIFW